MNKYWNICTLKNFTFTLSRDSHKPVKGRLLPVGLHPERGELHHLLLLDSWQSVAAGEGGGGWSGLWKVINTVLKY